MRTIKELVDHIKSSTFGRSNDEAPAADAETAAEGTTDEATGDETETLVTEEVIAALSLLGEQTEQIIKAVGLIDARVEGVSQLATQNQEVVRGLAKTEVERVQDALREGKWYKQLFVASKSAKPLKEGDTTPALAGGEMSVPGAGAGLLGPIMDAGR